MNLIERIKKLEYNVAKLLARSFMYYAKNTYVVTYLGNTTPGVTTYTTQAGFYTQIGRVVFFNGFVVWTAATGTGNANISLPFTPDSTANMRYAVAVSTENVTFAGTGINARIAPGQAFFNIVSPNTNAASTFVGIEAAGSIIFGGFFFV